MIESIMFLGLGFLTASLIALIVLPFVHARAVRLTTRRVEAAAPVSIAEIQADKDQLRAEFAMSTRRLEMSVEQLKARTTGQLSELTRKAEAANQLKSELDAKIAAIAEIETQQKALQDRLRISEEGLAAKANTLQDIERKLGEKHEEIGKLGRNIEDHTVNADSQRIEMVALKTHAATLRDQTSDLEQRLQQTEARLTRERAEAVKVMEALEEERGKADSFGGRIVQMERQLATQAMEAELFTKRVGGLEGQLTTSGHQFGDVSRERDQLRADLDAAQLLERELRAQIATTAERHAAATRTLRAEKDTIEAQLEQSRAEQARLAQEVGQLKRNTEAAWESERVENALLRERINDVSAEVAHLTAALEGPGSPINAAIAINGTNGHEPAPSDGPVSLADRIRALQSRASARVSAAR